MSKKAQSHILLPVASPLLAPLYLAKAQTLSAAWAHVDFQYADPPRHKDEAIFDPHLQTLLALSSHHRTNLLAVADPMRILNVPKTALNDEPLVLGSLIKSMCYWAIDERAIFEHKDKFIDKLRGLVVHPDGMTGYVVPLYDMLEHQGIKESEFDKDKFLFQAKRPGQEEYCYRMLRNRPRRNFGDNPLAYVTMDPIAGNRAMSPNSDSRCLKWFATESAFQDVIMTGLITGKDLYGEQKDIIEDLLVGIGKAVGRIQDNPVRASIELEDYSGDPNINFGKDYHTTDVLNCISMLARGPSASGGAYNRELEITDGQIRKSKQIRKRLENLLQPTGRSLDEFDALCRVANKVQSKPDNDRAFIHIAEQFDKVTNEARINGERAAGYVWIFRALSGVLLLLAKYLQHEPNHKELESIILIFACVAMAFPMMEIVFLVMGRAVGILASLVSSLILVFGSKWVMELISPGEVYGVTTGVFLFLLATIPVTQQRLGNFSNAWKLFLRNWRSVVLRYQLRGQRF